MDSYRDNYYILSDTMGIFEGGTDINNIVVLI